MKQTDYITKEYLDERFEYYHKDIRQHMTDLKSGFTEQIKSVCDQVTSLNQKMDRMQIDISQIKDVLEEKTDTSETRAMEKRITRLETKNA